MVIGEVKMCAEKHRDFRKVEIKIMYREMVTMKS